MGSSRREERPKKSVLQFPEKKETLLWYFLKKAVYDAKGQRLRVRNGNNVTTDYTYDPLTYRLTEIKTYLIDNETSPIQHLQYEYDAVGNIVKKKNLKQPGTYYAGTWTSSDSLFDYDPMYRLVEAKGREHLGQTALTEFDSDNQYFHQSYDVNDPLAWTEFNEQYSYDKVGNILQLKHRSQEEEGARFTRNYLYAETNNQLLDIAFGTTPSGSTFGYDAQGNCTQMPSLPTMGWDVLGRMDRSAKQVSSGLPETTWYQYDLQGNRVRKITTHEISGTWVGTMPTLYRKNCRSYLGDWELYRTYNGGGSVNKEVFSLHISDEMGRFALIESEGTTVRTRYQHTDHLGSSHLETDDSGVVISYEEYHPFGTTAYQATLSSLGSAAKRYRYCGKERDEESGLYYYGARYYASWLGRWITVDPKESERHWANGYNYCQNNPVNRVDPNGAADEDLGFRLALNFTFGTNNQSFTSLSTSVGYSFGDTKNMTGFNLSANIYNGGPGTDQPKSGLRSFGYAFTLGISQTMGGGTGVPTDLDIFNSTTLSAVTNKFENSFTIGTNLTFNNATGFNRAAGFAGKLGGFTATINEDFSFLPDISGNSFFGNRNSIWGGIGLLASGKDEGETGGGKVQYTSKEGFSISIGTEIFTGKPLRYNKPTIGGYVSQKLVQERLNVGNSFIKVDTKNFGLFQFMWQGETQMFSQNVIHDRIHIGRFRSKAQESFKFSAIIPFKK